MLIHTPPTLSTVSCGHHRLYSLCLINRQPGAWHELAALFAFMGETINRDIHRYWGEVFFTIFSFSRLKPRSLSPRIAPRLRLTTLSTHLAPGKHEQADQQARKYANGLTCVHSDALRAMSEVSSHRRTEALLHQRSGFLLVEFLLMHACRQPGLVDPWRGWHTGL